MHEVRSSQAETALSDLKGSEDAKAKKVASKTKYAALQARIQEICQVLNNEIHCLVKEKLVRI
jgi:hypothetical protein